MKTLQTIDYSEAQRIVTAIAAQILKRESGGDRGRRHSREIDRFRTDRRSTDLLDRIAINKAWTAARERKPTKDIGEKVRHPEKPFDIAYFGDPKFVGWGGGIPVWRNGQVIGSIAVSGLSADEDAELATLGAQLIEGA